MKVIVIKKGLARKMPDTPRPDPLNYSPEPEYPCPIEWEVGSEKEEGKDFKLESLFGVQGYMLTPIEKEEEDGDKLWDEVGVIFYDFSTSAEEIIETLKNQFTIKRKQ